MMKSLKEVLLEHPPQLLRAIAELHHITITETSRDALATQLAAELSRAEVAQRAWQMLSAEEHAILTQLLAQGGKAKAFQLVRAHGEIRSFGPVALARDKPYLKPANALEHLWYLGLIQRAFDVVGDFRGEIFFVPAEVSAHWPQPALEPPSFTVKPAPAPALASAHGDALMWDMFAFMVFVMREEPRLTADGVLSEADAKKLSSQLSPLTPSPLSPMGRGVGGEGRARLDFITRLAIAARLVKAQAGAGLRLHLNAKEWLKASAQQRRLQLLEAWQRDRYFNELAHVPSLKLEATGWRNDPRLARQTVVKYLKFCPLDAWVSLASFIAGIKQIVPDFQRPDGDYDRWHIRDAETGKLLTGFTHWQHVEGALLVFLFTGPLQWLGIVSVGGATGEPTAFRLTDFGARALELTKQNLPEPIPQKFIAQGDFDLLVPHDTPLYARFQLERMADRTHWDRVSTYHLSRESVTRLLRQHVTLDQILAFLKRASRQPFPSNVEFTLREWASKFGEVTLRRAAILHTRDQRLLRELQALPDVKGYILEVLSPTVALVKTEALEELEKKLQALGYAPQVIVETVEEKKEIRKAA
jgi:hypothetical protein